MSVHLAFASELEYRLAVTVLSARSALHDSATVLRAIASAVYHDPPLPGQLPAEAHVVTLSEALDAIRLEAKLHRKPRTYEPWRTRRRSA